MLIAAPVPAELRGTRISPYAFVEQAVRAEADGFSSVWGAHLFTRVHDALSVLAVAAESTNKIRLGVCAAPSSRRPGALSQISATVRSLGAGRLCLAVGTPGAASVDRMDRQYGPSSPAEAERFLAALTPAVVGAAGKEWEGVGGLVPPADTATRSPIAIVLGARSPAMVRVAGASADGVVTWLAAPETLRGLIAPCLREAARDARRSAPRIVAAMPVAVCGSVETGREAAERIFREPRRQSSIRSSVGTVAELAVVGPESLVEQQIREFRDAGVSEFWPMVMPVGAEEGGTLSRSRELLRGLAVEFAGELPVHGR